jgi:hypothetical protein
LIDHFQLATNGIGPGWSTFGFATNGFGFEIEVVVRPVQPSGGGYWAPAQPYEIIIRVKYKGKVWEERRIISELMAKSLEKVIASFKKISIISIQVKSSFMSMKAIQIVMKAFSRHKYNNKHS